MLLKQCTDVIGGGTPRNVLRKNPSPRELFGFRLLFNRSLFTVDGDGGGGGERAAEEGEARKRAERGLERREGNCGIARRKSGLGKEKGRRGVL